MSINYLLGRLLARLGYTVQRSCRYPKCTLNLMDLAYLALSSRSARVLQVVQIGAFDGKEADPLCRILERTDIVHAILVEPQAAPFASLKAKYSGSAAIALENAAISDHDGETVLYVPMGGKPSPKASLDPMHQLRFGGQRHRHTQPTTVRAMTMKSLLDKHDCRTIDVLQIDTEGYDFRVLKQAFDLSIFPTVINLETWHLPPNERKALRQMFKDHGYSFVDAGRDTFAVRLEELHARAADTST